MRRYSPHLGFARRHCVLDEEGAARVYRFPISAVDLKTGVDRTLVLSVPYKGQLPVPKTNYSKTMMPDGKETWHTRGPHVLAVTGLSVEGPRLRVTLGMEKWARVLEFDLGELLGRKGG